MAIKVGLGAPIAPTGKGITKPAAATQKPTAPKIQVYRPPQRTVTVKTTSVFDKKTAEATRPAFKLPAAPAKTCVPQKLLPPQKAESQLPFRPVGPVTPPKPNTGVPQRQALKQPVFGDWPKAAGSSSSGAKTAAAVPTATADLPPPQTEVAVTSAPTGRTVDVAPSALPQDKPSDAGGGSYVDTTGGSSSYSGDGIVPAAEEAAAAAENATTTAIKAAAQAAESFSNPLKLIGGVAVVLAGIYVWRRAGA